MRGSSTMARMMLTMVFPISAITIQLGHLLISAYALPLCAPWDITRPMYKDGTQPMAPLYSHQIGRVYDLENQAAHIARLERIASR